MEENQVFRMLFESLGQDLNSDRLYGRKTNIIPLLALASLS